MHKALASSSVSMYKITQVCACRSIWTGTLTTRVESVYHRVTGHQILCSLLLKTMQDDSRKTERAFGASCLYVAIVEIPAVRHVHQPPADGLLARHASYSAVPRLEMDVVQPTPRMSSSMRSHAVTCWRLTSIGCETRTSSKPYSPSNDLHTAVTWCSTDKKQPVPHGVMQAS